jgi:hypothetical protein
VYVDAFAPDAGALVCELGNHRLAVSRLTPGEPKALSPKSDECAAEDNKHSPNDHSGSGRIVENDQIDHLPHHKQDRYIEADNAAELDGREIERQAVPEQKRRADGKKRSSRQPCIPHET